MRIISPVDNLRETPLLLAAGADELYGGYLPPDWRNRFSLLSSINQRTFAAAQIATEAELREIIATVHTAGRSFALTLNAPFYTDEQLPLIDDYVARMVGLGIDNLILADLGLLARLHARYPQIKYHASTLAHLGNAGAIRFYAGHGIERVVLPRHLTVAEMGAICRAVPTVKCDAFLLVGKCPNTEGLCTFHHVSPERVWPCEIPYEITAGSGAASPGLEAAIARQASWAATDRRHGCGLCAIPGLLDAGVHGVKLVGRGAPGIQKARNIRMTREFLELAASTEDFNRYRRLAMAAHRERFGAECHDNVCYYPEFFTEGE